MEEEQTFRTPRERRFYRRLRDSVKRWAQRRDMSEKRMGYLLVAPDLFVLLSRLALDGRVPVGTKAKVAAGIAYFVSPLDMVPDFLGPPGFLDDVVVAAWILHTVVGELNRLDPSILEDHWEGEEDVLQQVTDIVDRAEDVLGRGLRFVVRRLRSGKGPGLGQR
ncbi:MAG: YkvA family protein [Anaerolineae bacterium]|jgi:uncharacterized membrane protein YkvA (DUF1232 family)